MVPAVVVAVTTTLFTLPLGVFRHDACVSSDPGVGLHHSGAGCLSQEAGGRPAGRDGPGRAAAADTAYAIEFDTPSLAVGITKSGANPTRIVFAEGGLYRIAFTAQITSSSGSTVEMRFWPRVNGTNVAGSTMVASLHNNGATTVVSRDSIFQFSANDYLEAMWATDSTNGFLEAHAATAYAPASPSVTLSISRVQA